jgi:hypothetical protein
VAQLVSLGTIPIETLRGALADWTDFDASAHMLAQCLGIVSSQLKMKDVKWVYCSENPLGTMLHSTLERLSDLGVHEKREEPDVQYRWCSAYRVAMDHA